MSYLLAIAEQLIRLKDKKTALDKKYEVDCENLRQQLEEVQNNCPHPKTTHHPDASGNGDDSNTCDLCEKEL